MDAVELTAMVALVILFSSLTVTITKKKTGAAMGLLIMFLAFLFLLLQKRIL